MRSRFFRRLSIGAGFAIGLWLIAEAAVTLWAQDTLTRRRAPIPPTHTDAPYLPGSPWLLWEMTPGTRQEMGATVTVNSLGIRGPEILTTKPAGIRRVLVMGDSSIYGHGIDDDKVFSQLLDVQFGPTIEVLNGGVPGYSSLQSLNLLRMRLLQTEPDVLIIANLWSDNNFDSFVDAKLLAHHHAYQQGVSAQITGILEHSAVFQYLDWKLRLAPRERAVQAVGWMLGREPQGHQRRVPINEYAGNLQEMCDLMHARGGDVVFLSLANSVDLGAKTTGTDAWSLYKDVMAETATRNGAPLVDIVASFSDSQLGIDDLFLDEMHPTPAGHQLIASAIERVLSDWVAGAPLNTARSGDAVPVYSDPHVHTGSGTGPIGPPPETNARIVGTITSSTRTPLQIDALDLREESSAEPSTLLGSERIEGPGPFLLRVPANRPIGLLIYLDRDGDGPSAGDQRIDLRDQPVEASTASDLVVQIDLDAGSVVIQ